MFRMWTQQTNKNEMSKKCIYAILSVIIGRISRALNCDDVSTFGFFWKLQPYGKRESAILSLLAKVKGAKMRVCRHLFQTFAPLSRNDAAPAAP